MIGLAIDILIDLFLLLFPIGIISKDLKQKPKRLAELKPVFEKLGFKKIGAKEFAKQTATVFFSLAVVAFLLFYALQALQFNDLENVGTAIDKIMQLSPFLLAYLLIVRVFAEEVFFRGFLVRKLGVVPSTVVFALAHSLYFSYAEVLGAFVLGLVLATWFSRKKNIYPVLAAHFLYNLMAVMLIL